MRERHHSNRAAYQFDIDTKYEAKERASGKCEWCGREFDHLEAHHLVAIWLAREIPCLATIVITSLANIAYICPKCHADFHARPETPEKYIPYVAQVAEKYLDMKVNHTVPKPEKLYKRRR